jgi:hypothetical protein
MFEENTIVLPKFLPTRRSWSGKLPEHIGRASDLPPYLFLGELDETSIRDDKTSWQAIWQRDAETWHRLEYDKHQHMLKSYWCWQGSSGGFSLMHSLDWRMLTQLKFSAHIDTWEEAALEIIEGEWNVRYIKHEEGIPLMAGMPDGLMKTFCLPVSAHQLGDLVTAFESLGDNTGIDFPVTGFVRFVYSSVHYVEGKNPDWATDAQAISDLTIVSTGLPILTDIERKVAADGSAAWTVWRLIYMAFIHVPFAGVLPLIQHLANFGLIAKGPMSSEPEGPNIGSIELAGAILPAGLEFQTKSIHWGDKQRSRQVYYLMPENLMASMMEMAGSSAR